jgi:hypothetical protein
VASFAEFVASDPELGALATDRVGNAGLILLGTLRSNGWPRISPVEPLLVGGQLYLGMMWQSKKALDLLRDPRCVVHSTVTNTDGSEGDVKIYGRGVDIVDPAVRECYCSALFDKIGWRPDGAFHLFALDITEVGYFCSVDGGHDVRVWRGGS